MTEKPNKPDDSLSLFDILSLGYFPKELPPIFSTKEFSESLEKKKYKPDNGEKTATEPASFNIPQSGLRRRTLQIPTPELYARASNLLLQNKEDLPDENKSRIASYVRPFDSLYAKKMYEEGECASYDSNKPKEIQGEEAAFLESRGFVYRLTTDIAQFYPSIYTHSIPWAIRGKKEAKEKQGDNHWSNKLDECVRCMQNKETKGVVISPWLSFAIAEIILSKIDIEITIKFNEAFGENMWSGGRYVDDMWFYFSHPEHRKDALHIISEVLSEYRLEINSQKTKMEESPFLTESIWKTEIQDAGSAKTSDGKINFSIFRNTILHWAKELQTSTDNPIKYGLSMIEGSGNENFWKDAKSMILQAIHIEPNCIPKVVSLLERYQDFFSEEDKEHIRVLFEKKIAEATKTKHEFEACWLLHALSLLSLPCSQEIAEIIIDKRHPMIVLSLYLLDKKGLVKGKRNIPKELKSILEDSGSLKNEWWLCAYEIGMQESMASNWGISSIFSGFFQQLKDGKVSFITKS